VSKEIVFCEMCGREIIYEGDFLTFVNTNNIVCKRCDKEVSPKLPKPTLDYDLKGLSDVWGLCRNYRNPLLSYSFTSHGLSKFLTISKREGEKLKSVFEKLIEKYRKQKVYKKMVEYGEIEDCTLRRQLPNWRKHVDIEAEENRNFILESKKHRRDIRKIREDKLLLEENNKKHNDEQRRKEKEMKRLRAVSRRKERLEEEQRVTEEKKIEIENRIKRRQRIASGDLY